MKYIEAPNKYNDESGLRIFLAGGITGCPNWQQEMKKLLDNTSFILFNPRRKNFPIENPYEAERQISWEHHHLRKADIILFWFAKETIQPIVLYELGAWSMTEKLLFIGIHPQYSRRRDVEIQTKLVRPDIEIVYSMEELSKQIIKLRDNGCYECN